MWSLLATNLHNVHSIRHARLLDSIYLMTFKLLCNRIFGVKALIFSHYLWTSLHSLTNYEHH